MKRLTGKDFNSGEFKKYLNDDYVWAWGRNISVINDNSFTLKMKGHDGNELISNDNKNGI